MTELATKLLNYRVLILYWAESQFGPSKLTRTSCHRVLGLFGIDSSGSSYQHPMDFNNSEDCSISTPFTLTPALFFFSELLFTDHKWAQRSRKDFSSLNRCAHQWEVRGGGGAQKSGRLIMAHVKKEQEGRGQRESALETSFLIWQTSCVAGFRPNTNT